MKLAFQSNQIAIYYDGALTLTASDQDTTPGALVYSNGAPSVEFFTDPAEYVFSVSNYVVSTLAVDDSYVATGTNLLTVSAPGFLTNDTEIFGASLSANLLAGTANGNLTFDGAGGFTYAFTNGAAYDSFSYLTLDGSGNLGTATVTIVHAFTAQTISFGPLADHTYGDSPFNLSATASSSGLPVGFTIASGPAAISNLTPLHHRRGIGDRRCPRGPVKAR